MLTALLDICPEEKRDSLKERGLMFARMGRYTQAREDLKNFLQECTDPVQRLHVENLVRLFASRTELIN